NDINKTTDFLNNLIISDVVDIIIEYPEHSTFIIQNMFIHRSVNVFKVLELNFQKEIINNLPAGKTAELLNELAPDDRTAFLEELPKAVIRELVKLLNNEERKITLSMLGYPEDSVGRLMTPDYVYVYSDNTITEAFEIVRKYAKNSETIDIIYVIDEKGGLVDDIRIKDLILADLNKKVSDISDGRFIALNAHDDQDMARQVFKKNNRVALPVLDDNKILLGIVTIDDILWVADEEFSEDIQKIGGTESFNESYLDIPLLKLIRKRVSWLVVLFLGELLTANVMGSVENELSKAIVLSLFIPLILSSGGNSGSQASTLIIQAMTIGDIKIRNWFFVLKREIISGLI
ncbi:MAG: magnesium transporter, partial [Sediminibacterium sp.]|nr:magnesium transporter [Sediminibacterium sp.]